MRDRARWGWPIPAVVALALSAGCTHLVDGTAVKAVPALAVGATEVGELVGAELANTTADVAPPEPVTVDPKDCAVAAGPSTTAVYTPGWTQYHLVTMQEAADYWDHSVTQTAGKYPDEAAARTVFDALVAGVRDCTGDTRATATDALDESTSTWTFHFDGEPDQTAARWTAAQDGSHDWSCFREARLTGAWVVQSAVCQVGNGRPAATALAEQVAANVADR
ncbi:MAG TPA: sensor domain-containing protein [Mycolicibacillus parakoreensis]|nr:sensor domain-containing protein [Mycolicibacillus parakoreensis]